MFLDTRSSPLAPVDTATDLSNLNEVLTLDEVAAYLRVSKKTVYNIARSGALGAFKAGKHWRVRRAELGAWIKQQVPEDRERQ